MYHRNDGQRSSGYGQYIYTIFQKISTMEITISLDTIDPLCNRCKNLVEEILMFEGSTLYLCKKAASRKSDIEYELPLVTVKCSLYEPLE